MLLRYRRATPEDLSRQWSLLEPERPLFSSEIWNQLRELVVDLLRRERILLCLLEDIQMNRIRFFGASGFVRPEFLHRAVACDGKSVIETAFFQEAEGIPAFMNYKEVAEFNRNADLRLLNFFGTPTDIDPDRPETLTILNHAIEAWNFFHKGFQIREVWYEAANPLMAALQKQVGLRVQREKKLPGGVTVTLFRLTREEALKSGPLWPGSAMISERPRFGFTRVEQKLLEMALLDHSDRDVSLLLNLTTDGVKKRWRSIYSKVMSVEPSLLSSELSGADQRRSLLQFLRRSLEELRPY